MSPLMYPFWIFTALLLAFAASACWTERKNRTIGIWLLILAAGAVLAAKATY